MIENKFSIGLRLFSDMVDFRDLIPEIAEYETRYLKKDEPTSKSGNFKAFANVFNVRNIYVGSRIDHIYDNEDKNTTLIIDKLNPLIKILSVIEVVDLQRELRINGSIKYDQFGFGLGYDLVNLLAKNKYAISFSGISYLET
jgi:hypothetical protein